MSLPDAASIGSIRKIQNPQDAIEQATGRYEDAALHIPEEQRLPLAALPRAPEPVSFVVRGEGAGGR